MTATQSSETPNAKPSATYPEILLLHPHSAVRERIDVFSYRVRGIFTRAQMADLMAFERRAWTVDHVSRLYILVELCEGASLSPGVLTDAVKLVQGAPPISVAVMTTSFLLRTAMEFYSRMSRAAGRNTAVRLCTHEEEARRFLDAERQRHEVNREK